MTKRAPTTVIVKVQVPLFTTAVDAAEQILVYPQTRQNILLQWPTDDVISALNGDHKGYFEATWLRGHWIIGRRVEDQPW